MPPHLKKTTNQAHLENGTYEQIVAHLEKEIELKGLEAPDELQINTVSHNTENATADRPKPTCHHCKINQGATEISVDCWRNSENKLKIVEIILETKTETPIPRTRAATSTILTTTTKTATEPKESQKLFTHPVRHVARQTIPQRKAIMEPMQPIDCLSGSEDRKDKIRSEKEPIKTTRMKLLRLHPKI